MDDSKYAALKALYDAAVNSFIDNVRDDPNVIAVIVSGSVAYDKVWEKSDVDMTMVVRDQVLKNDNYCIIEDGITINVYLMTRSNFKRGMERNLGGSFNQAYFSKGKMVYTNDDSLKDYFEDIKKIGSDDIAFSVLYMAAALVGMKDKSEKWLIARKDPLYAQYYILKSAEMIANMEVCLNSEPPSREAIQQAMKLNPDIMNKIYTDAMSHHFTEAEIKKAIQIIDDYIMKHIDIIKKPVIDFLSDEQIKTMTLIAKHFQVESHFIIEIFDYLAEKGIIEKVSQTIRITPKSKLSMEEIGYIYIP